MTPISIKIRSEKLDFQGVKRQIKKTLNQASTGYKKYEK